MLSNTKKVRVTVSKCLCVCVTVCVHVCIYVCEKETRNKDEKKYKNKKKAKKIRTQTNERIKPAITKQAILLGERCAGRS